MVDISDIPDITADEILFVLQLIKCRKASGEDEIATDLFGRCRRRRRRIISQKINLVICPACVKKKGAFKFLSWNSDSSVPKKKKKITKTLTTITLLPIQLNVYKNFSKLFTNKH